MAQLAELTVPSAKVGRVRLDNLVEFHAGTGPARINRHSRQRQVSLYGNITPGHAFGDILNDIMHQAALLACRPRTPSRGCPPARTPLTVAGRSRRSGC